MSRSRWSRQHSLKIDKRNIEDIQERIRELAASYTPEWRFDEKDPDIGSTLGILFSKQMMENVGRYNQVLDKYHTEFVNMLGISLLPAKPASSVVLLELAQDTIPGVEVKRRTKLLSGREDERHVFETVSGIYVSGSQMKYAFMTDGEEGTIVPLLGHFEAAKLLDDFWIRQETEAEIGQDIEQQDLMEETILEMQQASNRLKPFVLFGTEVKGIEQNALLFFHESVFDVEDDNIYVKVIEQEKTNDLFAQIKEGRYHFSYYSKDGFVRVEECEFGKDGQSIILKKTKENQKVVVGDVAYSVLMLDTNQPVTESQRVERILFSSSGKMCPIEFAGNGVTDFDVQEFDPFGNTISLFQECHIGHDAYFAKKGAHVKLQFEVSYLEHEISLTKQQEDEQLKIIKKKPRTFWTDTQADAYVEEISLEYFNGIGWKKLPSRHEYRGMFSVEKKGHYEISFDCPKDWQATSVGAYEGRTIRLQILKSDNCYMRPCIHHYPHIVNPQVSYSYEGNYVDPQRVMSVAGTSRIDVTGRVQEGKGYTAFAKNKYGEDALYLGFHKKFEAGPISLLFQLEEGIRCEGLDLKFAYSTAQGFKQMKVVDHTAKMSRTGVVMFVPPANMVPTMVEGKQAYWIKISRSRQQREKEVLPRILGIYPNAVEVQNVETRPEQEFYLEEAAPNMLFDLGISDILDIDLWVNEMGQHTVDEMRRMLREKPECVRAEYGPLGEITALYVKWEEAEQLYGETPERIYGLDRMNRQLFFGDGIHAQIPRVLDDVAFRVTIRCCAGTAGNVEAGQITESLGNLLYINGIFNPIKAFGGSNMESLDNALERGANILGSRNRLVSLLDYEREILAHSDNIDKVKGITGLSVTGEMDEESVAFALLLKDFAAGSYSFHYEAGNLKQYLLQNCEITVAPEHLHIVEPIFVTVSVDVWLQLHNKEEHFEVQNLLSKTMEEYLNPVATQFYEGWEIGVLPQKSQIMMKLTALAGKAVIKKVFISAKYTDHMGTHEKELSEVECTPYMVCRSGVHEIHQM